MPRTRKPVGPMAGSMTRDERDALRRAAVRIVDHVDPSPRTHKHKDGTETVAARPQFANRRLRRARAKATGLPLMFAAFEPYTNPERSAAKADRAARRFKRRNHAA